MNNSTKTNSDLNTVIMLFLLIGDEGINELDRIFRKYVDEGDGETGVRDFFVGFHGLSDMMGLSICISTVNAPGAEKIAAAFRSAGLEAKAEHDSDDARDYDFVTLFLPSRDSLLAHFQRETLTKTATTIMVDAEEDTGANGLIL